MQLLSTTQTARSSTCRSQTLVLYQRAVHKSLILSLFLMTVFMQGCQEEEVPIQQAKLKPVQKQVENDLPADDTNKVLDQQLDSATTTPHPDHPIIITPPSGSRLTVKTVSAVFTLPAHVDGKDDKPLDAISAPDVAVTTLDLKPSTDVASVSPADTAMLPQDSNTENSRRRSTKPGSDKGRNEGGVENSALSSTAGQVPGIDEIAKAHAVGSTDRNGAQKQIIVPNGSEQR